jgi:WD40 repeat protein
MSPLELKGHAGRVVTAAFSRDGTRIVTGSQDWTARVWDPRTGASLLELKGHTREPGWPLGVSSAEFSSDGTRIVTGSADRTARVWDARIGAALLELKGHTESLSSATFSPDTTRIITVSRDGTARVWDARTGMSLLELKGQTGGVADAAFSPDGTRIVTGSYDGTARVWDARTGQELKGEPIPLPPRPTQISPDGRLIAHFAGNRVELVPLEPDAEEISYRRSQMRPNLWRYREGYDAARAARDDFAARFYLDRLPAPERKQREAAAAAERELAAGHTQDAIGHLVTASTCDPRDLLLALKVAALQAWFGRDREFAETCGRALAIDEGASDPFMAERIAKICCLRPAQERTRREAALALARRAVERRNYISSRSSLSPFQMALGMAEYRSGHFAAADAVLISQTGAMNYANLISDTSAFYRAMSLYRLGKEKEARQLVIEAASHMRPLPEDEKNPLASGADHDDLILWMAYKEAKALIKWEAVPAAPAQRSGK